jgi:hypothetical protein
MTQIFGARAEGKKSKVRSYVWIAACGVLAVGATMNYKRFQPKREWITIEVPNPPRALAQEMPRISSQRPNGAQIDNHSPVDR